MNNKVIKVLTAKHGQKVIEFWKSQGVDTCDLIGAASELDGDTHIYYGVVDGVFDNYCFAYIVDKAEIIELPSKTESSNIPQSKEELLECIQNFDECIRYSYWSK